MIDRDFELRSEKAKNETSTTALLRLMDSVFYPRDPAETYNEAMFKYCDEDLDGWERKMLEDTIVIDDHKTTYDNVMNKIHRCLKILGV